jgi:hypothetical protein
MINSRNTQLIKDTALQLGFSACGIAKAERLHEDAIRLENWLKKGNHGSMHYMENYFDKRIDPTLLVDDAKSVITLLMNYYPAEKQHTDSFKISKYAYGNDYHDVIKEKLRLFLAILNEKIGDIHGRGFVDSAPVMERAWAIKSGLGWVGKNGNLITKNQGSFFFIATLIIDVELEYDKEYTITYEVNVENNTFITSVNEDIKTNRLINKVSDYSNVPLWVGTSNPFLEIKNYFNGTILQFIVSNNDGIITDLDFTNVNRFKVWDKSGNGNFAYIEEFMNKTIQIKLNKLLAGNSLETADITNVPKTLI